MVDHELRRDLRIDRLRVAALVTHRVAHRRQVDDRGNAREVLQQDARRVERDLLRRLGAGDPARDRLGPAAGAQHVFEEDPKRVRKPRGSGVELVEPVALVSDT